jgi:hypothetical protein
MGALGSGHFLLADPDDEEEEGARPRQEAVATVREFLAGFGERG